MRQERPRDERSDPEMGWQHPLWGGMGLALLLPPHQHCGLQSQPLSELVPAPIAAELAHKLLILTVLSVLVQSRRFRIFNRN